MESDSNSSLNSLSPSFISFIGLPCIEYDVSNSKESFGVETADDVIASSVRRIPGFGPSYTNKLIDWRKSVERRFKFDPSKGIPRVDLDMWKVMYRLKRRSWSKS